MKIVCLLLSTLKENASIINHDHTFNDATLNTPDIDVVSPDNYTLVQQ